MMKKLFFIFAAICMAHCLPAETVRVLRFVPVAGAESEVAVDSLRKVVFTRDSVVLISAADGEATLMYKYDYQSILFAESTTPEGLRVTGDRLPERAEKFIKDGQLYIMYKGQMYNVQGRRVN